MFKRKSIDAQVGDMFIKAHDTKNNVWVVEKLFEHVDGIMHARLFNKRQPKTDRKSTRLNSSHRSLSRMPSSA